MCSRPDGALEVWFVPSASPGERGAEGMRVLAVDPGRMLSFTWDATPERDVRGQRTSVVVRLEPVGPERTRVTLVNAGFGEGSDWPASRAYFEKAWPFVLASLARRFEGGAEREAGASADR